MKKKVQKKILYLDMDGVLADFDKGVGRKKRIKDPPEMFVKGFFRKLPLMPGAKNAVKSLLLHKRLDIYILTKPTTKNLHCATEKFQWIEEHFPELLRKMFVACDKGHFNGHYLIDDDKKAWAKKFKGKFLHMDKDNSEESWAELLKYLEKYK
jgi:5'(3')-deoxyribonucleotidase